MFENFNIPPYTTNSRWYRFFIESDGTDATLTHSDLDDAELSENYHLIMPDGFHIVDIKHDFNSIPAESMTQRVVDIRFNFDGQQEAQLPNPANYDYGYIYILGHF